VLLTDRKALEEDMAGEPETMNPDHQPDTRNPKPEPLNTPLKQSHQTRNLNYQL